MAIATRSEKNDPDRQVIRPHTSLSCVIIQPAAGLLPWQLACVERLTNKLDVTIAGWISCAASGHMPGDPGNFVAKSLDRATRPRSTSRRTISPWMDSSRQRSTSPANTQTRCILNAEDVDWIRDHSPHFVLAFHNGMALHDEGRLARAGVWQFSEGSALPSDQAAPGLAALTQGDTRLTLSLWSQTDARPMPAPIARGHTPAVLHSRKRSLGRLYEMAPDLLHRAVDNLRAEHAPALSSPLDPLPAHPPAGWARFLAAMLRQTLRRWFEKAWLRQRWDIGVIPDHAAIPSAQQIDHAHWLSGPRSGFWADPCFVAGATPPALLVEEYLDARGKGDITRLDWANGDIDTAPSPSTLLRIEPHLSFPRSYNHAGNQWLVPEMATAGEQRAYRLNDDGYCADDKPTTIPGLCGIDPVLFAHGDQYWAFISPPGRRSNYQLDLYMAEDFFGPYRRHPASPVRIDPHGGRSAGPVIQDGSRLLRFGQVFGRHYGEAIDVFEITELSPERYAERRVERIRPAPGTGAGMHTIDFATGLTVIDRFRLEPAWRLLFSRLRESRSG